MATIQKSSPADAPLLVGLGTKTFLESHGHCTSATDVQTYLDAQYSLSTLEAELSNEENIFHTILFENKAVGYSKIIFNRPHPLIKNTAVTKLERLYILREFYDLKLGKTLFEFNVELSKAANQIGMWLFTWKENHRAIRFYQKAGFEIIGSADFKISETHSNPNHVMFLLF